ncbi:hypothetical protein EZV62_006561 [Acer yangbiense]|uniref:Uncharacterized protein n=1 Tax=Acer yangbiense TaxID=1000413 RepID=A0A5C7IA67_9ROSI|nr:hypothetical protein EZV62_006561 [Acer yangbiense]
MYRFRASTAGDEVVGAAGLGQWIHVSVPTGSRASLLHVSVPTVVDVAAATAATSNGRCWVDSFENGDYADANAQDTYCIDGSDTCRDAGTKLFNKKIETLFNLSCNVLDFLSMLPLRKNM